MELVACLVMNKMVNVVVALAENYIGCFSLLKVLFNDQLECSCIVKLC